MEETAIYHVNRNNTIYEFDSKAAADAFEALTEPQLSAMNEWTRRSLTLLKSAEKIVAEGSNLEMIYLDNDLFDLVLSVPDGAVIPGTTITKERAIAIGALLQDLKAWLAEPAVGDPAVAGLPTRRRIILQR